MQMTIKKLKDQEKERNGNPFMDGADDDLMISADSDDEDQTMRRDKKK